MGANGATANAGCLPVVHITNIAAVDDAISSTIDLLSNDTLASDGVKAKMCT